MLELVWPGWFHEHRNWLVIASFYFIIDLTFVHIDFGTSDQEGENTSSGVVNIVMIGWLGLVLKKK